MAKHFINFSHRRRRKYTGYRAKTMKNPTLPRRYLLRLILTYLRAIPRRSTANSIKWNTVCMATALTELKEGILP